MAPYVSVLCSTSRAIQYTVTRCSSSKPTPNTTAPGSNAVHGSSGGCGMCHETNSHTPTGTRTNSIVPSRPNNVDRSRTAPISAATASAKVTTSTSAPAARAMLGGFPARVCHTSAWTMRSTFSNARVASNRANPATKNDSTRWSVDRSPTLLNAFAATPPMPDSRARWPGDSPVALAPSPKITTTRKTYGIMNRNTRNATAPASTPPPADTSRSIAPSAVSRNLERGRFASRRSRYCSIRPVTRACSARKRSMRDRVTGSSRSDCSRRSSLTA